MEGYGIEHLQAVVQAILVKNDGLKDFPLRKQDTQLDSNYP